MLRYTLSPGQTASADEIRDHLLTQLAKFKIPRYIWFTDSALPRNASGKFLKRELRDTLQVADSHLSTTSKPGLLGRISGPRAWLQLPKSDNAAWR